MIVSSIHGSQHLRVGTSISALALALALPLGIERYRCLLVGPVIFVPSQLRLASINLHLRGLLLHHEFEALSRLHLWKK